MVRQLVVATAYFTTLLASTHAFGQQYEHKLDVQSRFDERSDRDHRTQYRLRYYPKLVLNDAGNWSLNAFVATGDSFSSSHNTIDDGEADYLYFRRLYVKHEHVRGDTELGVIPTYKKYVSSSGLSKDGWVQGLRHVSKLRGNNKLELTLGELNDTDAAHALGLPGSLDYIELEFTSVLNATQSFELSLERMTGGNFVRGEYRHALSERQTLFVEYLRRLDVASRKLVLGTSGELTLYGYDMEYFAHYSYVSDEIGPRAELTEDFLGTGHGVSAEIDGALVAHTSINWFARVDVVDSVARLLAGVQYKF